MRFRSCSSGCGFFERLGVSFCSGVYRAFLGFLNVCLWASWMVFCRGFQRLAGTAVCLGLQALTA